MQVSLRVFSELIKKSISIAYPIVCVDFIQTDPIFQK